MADLSSMLRAQREKESPFLLSALRVVLSGLAGLTAVGAMCALLSYVDPQFDIVANYAPVILVLAIAVCALALIVRRTMVGAAMAAMAIVASSWLIIPDVVAASGQGSPNLRRPLSIKIVSANLLSSNRNQAAFEDMIRREQPDIIFLQEAFGPWRETLTRLASAYPTRAGCEEAHLCNTVVLSKFAALEPIMPNTTFFTSVRLRLPQNFGGATLDAVSVHVSRPPPVAPQVVEIKGLRIISTLLNLRAVVAGDFNATPWTSAIRELDEIPSLQRRSRALFTWPTPFPVAPIDHVYAGSSWDVSYIGRGPDIGSDHYPIVAVLTLKQEP